MEIETLLKQVPSVEASAVIADRVVGKPYLEIDFKRKQIARYGLTIRHVQDIVEVAIGGRAVTTTVEGRERFPVRVRYLRELRNEIETMKKILVPAMDGSQIPLSQVAEIRYVRGPQVIKSEDTFLTAYVLFDMKPEEAEVNVVEECQRYFLQQNIDNGQFILPPGVSYTFAGNYENQIRSDKDLDGGSSSGAVHHLHHPLFSISLGHHHFVGVQRHRHRLGRRIYHVVACTASPGFLDFSVFDTNMRSTLSNPSDQL